MVGRRLEGAQVRVLKGVRPLAVSLGVMAAVTAILWHINLTTAGPRGLIYIYLFPVALIAALFNGRPPSRWSAPIYSCRSHYTVSPMIILSNMATLSVLHSWR
jgi:hypothetical protein